MMFMTQSNQILFLIVLLIVVDVVDIVLLAILWKITARHLAEMVIAVSDLILQVPVPLRGVRFVGSTSSPEMGEGAKKS